MWRGTKPVFNRKNGRVRKKTWSAGKQKRLEGGKQRVNRPSPRYTTCRGSYIFFRARKFSSPGSAADPTLNIRIQTHKVVGGRREGLYDVGGRPIVKEKGNWKIRLNSGANQKTRQISRRRCRRHASNETVHFRTKGDRAKECFL